MPVEYQLQTCPKCGGRLEYSRRLGHTILQCEHDGSRVIQLIYEKGAGGEKTLAKLPAYSTPKAEFAGDTLRSLYAQITRAREYSQKIKDIHDYRDIDLLTNLLVDAHRTWVSIPYEERKRTPSRELEYHLVTTSTDFASASNPAYRENDRKYFLQRARERMKTMMSVLSTHKDQPEKLTKPVVLTALSITIIMMVSVLAMLPSNSISGNLVFGSDYLFLSLIFSVVIFVLFLAYYFYKPKNL